MLKRLWHLTYRQARRVAVLLVGGTVLLFGVALIFLPGPAIVVIPAGLAILSIEFAWARAFLARVRREISERNRRLRMDRLD
jgi:tellurite resistance protein TerC